MARPEPRSRVSNLVALYPASARRVGRYELLAEIARGGMGTVYLCRQKGEAGFQRLQALKLMHRHLAENVEFVAMFLDEARLAASIHHHNVVSILDLGVCARGHYMVMEYIEGCTLGELLRGRRPEARLVAPIVLGMLEGLHAAHTHCDDEGAPMRLVHRDVSPANVLIGTDGIARLTDFGVAKARARLTCTQPGVLKGKLAYAAPEQLRGSTDIDGRVDVFAAGAVLWRALTGRNLFLGTSDASTIDNVLHRDVPPPSRVGPASPAELDPICLRALERDPDARYASAGEMARELRAACAKHDLLGAPGEVAAWVRDAFCEELSARRAVIRHAAQRPAVAEPSSARPPPLPELPSLRPSRGTGSHARWTPSSPLGRGEIEELDELEIEVITGIEATGRADESARSPSIAPARRWMWPVALAAAAALAGVLAAMVTGGSGGERLAPAAAPAAAIDADALPAPSDAAEPDPAPVIAPIAPGVDAAPPSRAAGERGAAAPATEHTRTRSTARSRRRPAAAPAAPAEPAAGTASEEPSPDVPEAPAPEPAQELELENNPYLRR